MTDREQLLSLALEIGRAGFFRFDFQTEVVHADASLARMLGMESGDFSASLTRMLEHVHPDDRELLTTHIAGLRERPANRTKLVLRMLRGPNEVRWFEFVGEPYLREASGIDTMLVIAQDITSRRLAELEAAEANLRRRLLFEQSSDGIVLLDAAMKVADANRAFAAMLGYTAQELSGLHAWDWDAEWPTREAFTSRWPRIPESPGTVETRHRRKNGSIFPVEVSWQPTEWLGRQLTYCVCRDISERQQIESERIRLAAIVEASSDLIATSDADGRITYINRAGRAMLGLKPSQSLGKATIRDYHPRWAYDIVLHQGIPEATQRGVWLGDTALRRRDDSELPVSQLILVHKDRLGSVEFISTIARDITARLNTEKRVRDADRRKDEFLAMLAHELRNPLAPICNALEVLKDAGEAESPVTTWCRDVIERQSEHLCKLVDDLLEVSRISRGRIELNRRAVDVAEVFQRAVETNRPLIDAHRIDLKVVLPKKKLWIDGDPVRLAQIVSNLLNNAVKYTDEGGRICLGAERDGQNAVIRVADSGKGIDPSILPLLFDLFYQADQTLDRARGGLGIGLSLVKNLVALHGGQVSAHSEGAGKGSEFVVSLPRSGGPEDKAPVLERVPTRASARLRILVVDDNRDSAESMAYLLRHSGHTVLTAHDGHDALKQAFSARPDVVLIDIGLPGLNGFDVCRQARSGGLDQALIIAVTGYADEDSRLRSCEAGFDTHLAKPVRVPVLQKLLAKHADLIARANPASG